MNWGHLLERANNVFYTNILADLTGMLVVILYFFHRGKNRCSRYLVWMAGSFLLQSLLVEWVASQPVKNAVRSRIAHDSLYVYLGIELTCSLLFIRCHTRPALAKKVLLWGVILFIPYMLYYWFSDPLDTGFNSNILTAEGFLIILACAWFFIELMTGRPDRNLFTEPAFWSISGMLVLFTVITPVFLLVNYFIHNREALFYRLYIANNVCYSLLFATFALTIARGRKLSGVR